MASCRSHILTPSQEDCPASVAEALAAVPPNRLERPRRPQAAFPATTPPHEALLLRNEFLHASACPPSTHVPLQSPPEIQLAALAMASATKAPSVVWEPLLKVSALRRRPKGPRPTKDLSAHR